LKKLLQKNGVSFVLLLLILVMLFSPGAKAWVLQTLLRTGIFNAGTTPNGRDTGTAPIANLVFTETNGTIIHTDDLKGRVLFINCWASWCPPCIAEMSSINALYNKLKDNPRIVFIMVDADNQPAKATDFMHSHHYNLPVYGLRGKMPTTMYSGTLPTTIIIDAKGRLAQKHEGIANYDTPAMQHYLQSLQ
jgi:thiol-disulfide isomerase/thioredoxin